MSSWVDLRSDTVTKPTPQMRRAMAEAEVGDDAYGEDPTVIALEEAAAARLGKEAALLVCSGVMGNQVALRTLARAGTEVIVPAHSHLLAFENAAAARNAGVQLHPLDDEDGTIDPDQVINRLEATAHHQPEVSLLAVEDTHMYSGGRPWPLPRLAAVAAAAGGIPVHLDGARIFNAEVATGIPAATRAAAATTVMFCLSKGLGAPVGSMLAGPAEVIARARRERSGLGGGMRQAGVLAAAGLVALSQVERLGDDHARATRLAEAVSSRWPEALSGPVQTNIVTFRHPAAERLLDHLKGAGVLAGTVGPGTVRMVTHLDVDDAGIDAATTALRSAP